MNQDLTNSEITEASVEAMIKKMTLVFFSLMAGILIFLLVIGYLVEIKKMIVSPSLDSVLVIVVPALALFGIIGGKLISAAFIKQAYADTGNNRLMKYQTACLIKYAFFEGPSLFSIIAYYLTGNRQYLIILAIVLVLMLFSKPSATKFREEMANKG